jgi:glutamate--cysteine ligase
MALKQRGVRYVELRSLDVSVFDPLGVNETELRFLEAFLVFCLLHDSPPIDADERKAIDDNQMTVANRGREPAVLLNQGGQPRKLQDWALEIITLMEGVCELLDQGETNRSYSVALEQQKAVIHDPDLTPSARIIAEMRRNKEPFFQFAKRWSEQHQAHFTSQPLKTEPQQFFTEQALLSLREQQELETLNEVPFAEYLQRYFAQS